VEFSNCLIHQKRTTNNQQPTTKKNGYKSLKARQDELAITNKQLEILNGGIFADGEIALF